MNPSVCVMWQTLLSYVRQSATTEVSMYRRGRQRELRSAELVKERRPKDRRVLIKSGPKWCWRGVRVCVHTRLITTRYPTNASWWPTDTRKKLKWIQNPTRANSNGMSGFRRISTTSDLDLYDPGMCAYIPYRKPCTGIAEAPCASLYPSSTCPHHIVVRAYDTYSIHIKHDATG